MKRGRRTLLTAIGPGLLVAATGVGAGDLATGALTGSVVGVSVLWAVLVGAFLKFVVNEGLARWQLATGSTLLEGASTKLGAWVGFVFVPYLVLWSFCVGSALMGACGVTAHAALPVFEDARTGKIVFGVVHSLAGLLLVRLGGFTLFERVMSVCIAGMFVTAVVTALLLRPQPAEVLAGLLPTAASVRGENLGWTVALMGGVGGTVTVLCYGYWMRELGRHGPGELRRCRLDLGVAYAMTAVFGLAMVTIGSRLSLELGLGSSRLVVDMAEKLGETIGPFGRWAFLLGAWAAVFSSLLGVWQATPYLFADLWRLAAHRRHAPAAEAATATVDPRGRPYRLCLVLIATVPAAGLFYSFAAVQKTYAIVGALFVPLLAAALLVLNGRTAWVGRELRNRWPAVVTLVAIVLFFLWYGWAEVRGYG
jgi:Mn2+/Fe2+ NRAMP family transporter